MSVGANVMPIDEQVIGSIAEAYVKFSDGNRYHLFNLINFESTIKVNTKKRGLLGRSGKVTYPTGWEGTWKATASYNTPIFRRALYEFKETGKFPAFDIQVTNENTTGTIGRQTVTHIGCYLDSAILSKIDIDSDGELTEDMSGTFNDFEIPNEFGVIEGMKQ